MNIIFKTKFGSHLYGTNTPTSDEDFKAIFIADMDDIIMKRDRDTIHEDVKVTPGIKFQKGDTNCEYIELRRFIKDALEGQTYALDMLFSPQDMWIQESNIWLSIVANREKLLSKDVTEYIGYCRRQAGKYGLKGSRLGELIRVIDWLRGFHTSEPLTNAIQTEHFEWSEYIFPEEKIHKHKDGKEVPEMFLCVLGKYFSYTRHICEVLASLVSMENQYGERARQAQQNEGVDWKAISHAYRCCYQLIELSTAHAIQFPLKQAPYLQLIKAGEIPYAIVQDELPKLMEVAVDAMAVSTLPVEPDNVFWEDFIIQTYRICPHALT